MRFLPCAVVLCLALVTPASAAVERVSVQVASKRPVTHALKAKVRVVATSAQRATVRFWLSADGRLQPRGDIRLRGSLKVGGRRSQRLARTSGAASGSVRLRIPASAKGGVYRLLACAGGRCGASRGKVRVVRPAAVPQPGGLGGVRYTARNCYAAKGVGALAAVPFATVRFTHPSRPTELVELDAAGNFTTAPPIDPAVPWRADLLLRSKRVEVGPDTDPFAPYAVPLGKVLKPGMNFVIGGGDGSTNPDAPSGAVNIFVTLERATRVAEPLVPVRMPALQVRWRYGADLAGWLGDDNRTAYGVVDDAIYVGGWRAGGFRAEWEAGVLVHELGHRVMRYVADPAGDDEEPDHGYHTIHRDKPTLAWSEGFAHAFSAIIGGSPEQTLACEPALDLSTFPATAKQGNPGSPMVPAPSGLEFRPVGPRTWLSGSAFAQDNEAAVAGAVWLVSANLGGAAPMQGDPASARIGLAKLLDAMLAYHAKYGGPEDIRDLRDALVEFEESGDDEHEIFNSAFQAHGIVGWGAHVELNVDPGDNTCLDTTGPGDPPEAGKCEDPYIQISASGPGGFDCRARVDAGAAHTFIPPQEGDMRVPGAAPHTWQDDCWTSAPGDLSLAYPFLPGRAHRTGLYTIRVKTHCVSHPEPDPNGEPVVYGECPKDYEIVTEYNTRSSDEVMADGYGAYRSEPLEVANNSTVTIATFSADGRTCVLAPAEPCNL